MGDLRQERLEKIWGQSLFMERKNQIQGHCG